MTITTKILMLVLGITEVSATAQAVCAPFRPGTVTTAIGNTSFVDNDGSSATIRRAKSYNKNSLGRTCSSARGTLNCVKHSVSCEDRQKDICDVTTEALCVSPKKPTSPNTAKCFPAGSKVPAEGDPHAVVGDYIRFSQGGPVIHSLTKTEAARSCACKGSRLPSAREIAKDLERYGGKLLEVSNYNAGKIPPGFKKEWFYKVDVGNPGGKIDAFYYSKIKLGIPYSESFNTLESDLQAFYAWSSSSYPTDDSFINNRNNGSDIEPDWLWSARCIQTID